MRQYGIRDRDGTIHAQPDRKGAFREQRAYGGLVVARKDGEDWKPYKRRRIFLWVFLAVQVIFIAWLISGATTSTTPSASDIASLCGNGKWQGLYDSYRACVTDAGHLLGSAATAGKGLGLGLIVGLWVAADVVLGITYGIYRLARR